MVKTYNAEERIHPYKSMELIYSTQIVNNSIKLKNNHLDITTRKCRIKFRTLVYS